MSYDVDSATVLYVLGVLFGLGALAYFLSDVVFDLSITVRAALLLAAFVAFLLVGLTVDREVLDVVAFALSAASYLFFAWYVLDAYDLGQTARFVLFALSAALFVGLGYAVQEHDLSLARDRTLPVIGALVLVCVVLVGAGAAAGGVSYALELEDSATVESTHEAPTFEGYERGTARVGTATATNEFVFREPLDVPDVDGCLVGAEGPEELVSFRTAGSHQRALAGGSELSVPVEASVPVPEGAGSYTLAVEGREDCDVERDEPTLIVVVAPDERPTRPS